MAVMDRVRVGDFPLIWISFRVADEEDDRKIVRTAQAGLASSSYRNCSSPDGAYGHDRQNDPTVYGDRRRFRSFSTSEHVISARQRSGVSGDILSAEGVSR